MYPSLPIIDAVQTLALPSSKQGQVADTSSKTMGQTLQKVIAAASAAQVEFGDSFVSTEHLLLALVREDTRFTKKALLDQGVDGKKILDAVNEIRGPQKVTNRNPEAAYEASTLLHFTLRCCHCCRRISVVTATFFYILVQQQYWYAGLVCDARHYAGILQPWCRGYAIYFSEKLLSRGRGQLVLHEYTHCGQSRVEPAGVVGAALLLVSLTCY